VGAEKVLPPHLNKTRLHHSQIAHIELNHHPLDTACRPQEQMSAIGCFKIALEHNAAVQFYLLLDSERNKFTTENINCFMGAGCYPLHHLNIAS
jgi:hypothetical protein